MCILDVQPAAAFLGMWGHKQARPCVDDCAGTSDAGSVEQCKEYHAERQLLVESEDDEQRELRRFRRCGLRVRIRIQKEKRVCIGCFLARYPGVW